MARSVEKAVKHLPGRDARAQLIPAQFLGEWNQNPADCGTDNNDTRLRITPAQLLFYESKADIREVTVENKLTVTVAGSFSGEGETWSDTYKMSLTPSGNGLVTGDLIRKRCR